MAKRKITNNDLQNTTQKAKQPTKIRGELMCSERVSISCPTSGIRRGTLVTNSVVSMNEERIG
jgi:hypothetical protein